MPLQHPNTTTTSLPPTFTITQPLQQPGQTLPSFATYTSFSGLPFDSQGFLIPYGSNDEFYGSFQTWEHNGHNCRLPVPGIDYRLRKLKMTLFNRDDVYVWVFHAERFFDIQGLVTSGERLKAVMMCLEGPALSWFRWTDNREPFRSWEDLKRRMLVRFQSSQEGGGTRGDVHKGVKIGAKHGGANSETYRIEGDSFKRITNSEFTDKRAKGLYYRCDGQYSPGHRCPEKALQVLLVDDEEEEKEEGMARNTFHLEDKVVFQGGGDDMNG
ncbi:ankyrin repeat-containing protein [Tanacetum coccineum]